MNSLPPINPAKSAARAVFQCYEHPAGLRCHGELTPNHFGWFYRTEEEAAAIISEHYRPILEEVKNALLCAKDCADNAGSFFPEERAQIVKAFVRLDSLLKESK